MNNKKTRIPITPESLEEIGFKSMGMATRLRISYYLELCYMHFDSTIRLQTVKSGFTEILSFVEIDEVVNFIDQFKDLSRYWEFTDK